MVKARREVGDRPDWWMPVLFLRLSDGCLWPPEEAVVETWQTQPGEPDTILIPEGTFIMGGLEEDEVPDAENRKRKSTCRIIELVHTRSPMKSTNYSSEKIHILFETQWAGRVLRPLPIS